MNDRDYLKNKKNAILANEIKIGDRVKVLKTGEIGNVTKIIVYKRDNDKWNSPFGYSSIQVRFNDYNSLPHHKKVRCYSASSLEIL
jgi:sulfate adenylyltransferase subunit 1 (EFTu-like GTPase family)